MLIHHSTLSFKGKGCTPCHPILEGSDLQKIQVREKVLPASTCFVLQLLKYTLTASQWGRQAALLSPQSKKENTQITWDFVENCQRNDRFYPLATL